MDSKWTDSPNQEFLVGIAILDLLAGAMIGLLNSRGFAIERWVVLVLGAAGCASGRTAQLEARVRLLEQQVATQRQAPARTAHNTPPASSSCTRVLDDSVPRGTAFNSISVQPICMEGTVSWSRRSEAKPRFELGGMYVVRGSYTRLRPSFPVILAI